MVMRGFLRVSADRAGRGGAHGVARRAGSAGRSALRTPRIASGEAPALGAPVHAYADPLDADRADGDLPRPGRVREDRPAGVVEHESGSPRSGSRPCPTRCWTSRRASPGCSADARLDPPRRLQLVGRAAGGRHDVAHGVACPSARARSAPDAGVAVEDRGRPAGELDAVAVGDALARGRRRADQPLGAAAPRHPARRRPEGPALAAPPGLHAPARSPRSVARPNDVADEPGLRAQREAVLLAVRQPGKTRVAPSVGELARFPSRTMP